MTGRPGELTGRVARDLAVQRHERAMALLDGEAIRRVLSGAPTFLTLLEREAVFVLADTDGIDRATVAAGLEMKRDALDRQIWDRRARAPQLTRDLWAASALRPAAELIAAVGAGDAGAVASLLCALNPQRLAALAVVLAAAVADPGVLTGITTPDDAAT